MKTLTDLKRKFKPLERNELKYFNGGYDTPGECSLACGKGCKRIENEWFCL